MKKQFTLIIAMIMTLSLSAQAFAEIITDSAPICAGFSLSNMARVQLMPNSSQIEPAPNSRIEYVWTVQHGAGEWVWHNYTEERMIPIPWAGTYTVQIKVMYFLENRTQPYIVFFSNPVFIQGIENCGE